MKTNNIIALKEDELDTVQGGSMLVIGAAVAWQLGCIGAALIYGHIKKKQKEKNA